MSSSPRAGSGRVNIPTSMVALIAAFVVSTGAMAAESWHTFAVKKVYPLANGTFLVVFDTNASDCPNTILDKYHYVSPTQSGMSDAGCENDLYSASLAALYTRGTVTVAFDDAATNCFVSRITVRI